MIPGNNTIKILDSNGEQIGTMIQVTSHTLNNDAVISKLTQWRSENKIFFKTRFEPTCERTKKWIQDIVIPDKNRILFLIYIYDELIGQYGLRDISDTSAEGDNLIIGDNKMRGPMSIRIMVTMFKWAFDTLGIEEITGSVLLSNKVVLLIDSRLGFEEVNRVPLISVVSDGELNYVEKPGAEVYDDMYVFIRLKKSNFKYIDKL